MSHEVHPRQSRLANRASVTAPAALLVLALLGAAPNSPAQSQSAQSQVVTLRLGADQIGLVKTAEKITTRIAFQEPVKEIICGDLYDPESGTGSFVIQRIEADVFIKPVAPKGVSNMFVRTGGKGERIYGFSLSIVPAGQVHFVVNVLDVAGGIAPTRRASRPAAPPPAVPPVIASVGRGADVPASLMDSLAGIASPGPLSVAGLEQQPPAPKLVRHPQPPDTVAGKGSPPSRDVLKRVKPTYPDYAVENGITGQVIVEIMIDDMGKVTSAQAISGPPFLRNAAVSAARGWRFRPVGTGQGPGKEVSRITFNFRPEKF